MSALLELPGFDFTLPAELADAAPAEARGLARDAVRLLVASPAGLTHATFRDLPAYLEPGDLLVVNTSATLPAALPLADGRLLHLSTRPPGGYWVVELRRRHGDGSRPYLDGRPGELLALPGDVSGRLLAAYPAHGNARLWLAALDLPDDWLGYLHRHAHPIRYAEHGRWPLSAYQTVFAGEPGSAEMPSAGRPFTPELVTALIAKGIEIAPVVLHAGVSSQDAGEAPYAEAFRVPATTAARVNAARRVIAVGTTVTRALETVADEHGTAHPGAGWTELVLSRERPVRVVDGLLTGWHAPQASHLALLEAVAGRDLLSSSYAEAMAAGYHWHEFGDLHLLLR